MVDEMDALGMLDLITAPGFCVKENRIVKVNSAGALAFFAQDMEILPLLGPLAGEYAAFSGGCLCLVLTHLDKTWNASVTR